ncbi:MAG: TonB family protein, partial [Pseudomonadota bacterium]
GAGRAAGGHTRSLAAPKTRPGRPPPSSAGGGSRGARGGEGVSPSEVASEGGVVPGSGSGSSASHAGAGDPALQRIWKRINSSKYYPQIARSRRIEGAPRVTFAIGEDGSVKSAGVATSCGEALLDEAAVEAVRRAAPLPFYPGPITVTVRYSLKD